MSVQILHIADIHIDERSIPLAEQIGYLRSLADLARRYRPDAVVIAGDLVCVAGERQATISERDALLHELIEPAAAVCPVAIVRGNHDAAAEWRWVDRLALGAPVTYYDRPCVAPLVGADGDVIAYIHPLPWGAATTAPPDPTRDVPAILVGHAHVRGGTVGLAQVLPSVAEELEPESLTPFDAALLGHLHDHQSWRAGSCLAAYAGAPWAHTYGERHQAERGALLWTVDVGTAAYERLPIPSIHRLAVEWRWDADIGRFAWPDGAAVGHSAECLLRAPLCPPAAELRGARLRLRLHHPPGVRDAIPEADIRAAWRAAGVARLDIEHAIERAHTVAIADLAERPSVIEQIARVREEQGRPLSAAERAAYAAELQEVDRD